MNKTVLVIDCRPGGIRPDGVLKYIINGTKLIESDFNLNATSFGAWSFGISNEKRDLFLENRELIIERLNFAYKNGSIRYAEYYFD